MRAGQSAPSSGRALRQGAPAAGFGDGAGSCSCWELDGLGRPRGAEPPAATVASVLLRCNSPLISTPQQPMQRQRSRCMREASLLWRSWCCVTALQQAWRGLQPAAAQHAALCGAPGALGGAKACWVLAAGWPWPSLWAVGGAGRSARPLSGAGGKLRCSCSGSASCAPARHGTWSLTPHCGQA